MIFLFLIPVFVSLVVGIVFVRLSSAGPAWKLIVVAVFALAFWLQFLSRYATAGLLLQTGLALGLLLWRRVDGSY